MANSFKFDVFAYDLEGSQVATLHSGVTKSEAIFRAAEFNRHNELTAVVVPADSEAIRKLEEKFRSEQSANASLDAYRESDDSNVKDEIQDAAAANVAKRYETIRESFRQNRSQSIREAFLGQLEVMRSAADLLTDAADLGIMAASLEQLAKAIDDVEDDIYEEFDYGLSGDLRYTELEAALGVVR